MIKEKRKTSTMYRRDSERVNHPLIKNKKTKSDDHLPVSHKGK